MAATESVQKHSVHTLVFRSLKRTHDMFVSEQAELPPIDPAAQKLHCSVKTAAEYAPVVAAAQRAKKLKAQQALSLPAPPTAASVDPSTGTVTFGATGGLPLMITDGTARGTATQNVAPPAPGSDLSITAVHKSAGGTHEDNSVKALLPKRVPTVMKPEWHAPWKLYRVISGHTGWVRCVDVEPGNEWFATGAADRIVKIWDLASGQLKLSLTGHVSTVRAVKVSLRQPYLFSAGEDKQVKCWDLEYNKVIRHYHGHLSGVYSMAVHPTIDVLITSSRDSTARVWDIRTKAQVHCLSGHTNTVASVITQAADPQVITASHDATIRLWDLAAGKSVCTLTHHKKSVRALAHHPALYMFASASPDNIKQWKCPNGEFVQNMTGHNSIVNCLAANEDGVLVSGGDNGSMQFWDWKSGFCFQKYQSKPQPGSIDSESGLFGMTFDQSQSRLIAVEADKTIKMYKEDETATEESNPILWRPDVLKRKQY